MMEEQGGCSEEKKKKSKKIKGKPGDSFAEAWVKWIRQVHRHPENF